MKYFRNFELSNMFGVSQAAVGKWVNSAKNGKLDLLTTEVDGRVYIANTPKNLAKIEDMVKERRKYFNTRSLKVIEPKSAFYELYSVQQIFDLISNVEVHREFPLQYTYFDGGADWWNDHSAQFASDDTPNLINSTIALLDLNMQYLAELLERYKKINIIDIGVGNGDPIVGVLKYLKDKNVLGRYVGIDISQEMLDTAETNLKKALGKDFQFEGYVRDINYDRFVDIIAPSSVKANSDDSVNVVFLLGGTLCNFRNPADILKVIYSSLGKGDKFIYSGLLDSPNTRLHFDLEDKSGVSRPSTLDRQNQLLPDLLNIDPEYYDVEEVFNKHYPARQVYIRLKVAITIKLSFGGHEHQIHIGKGERILIYRHHHLELMSTLRLFDSNGFNVLQVSRTMDRDYIITIAEMKTEQPEK